jgi:hypothetical protein
MEIISFLIGIFVGLMLVPFIGVIIIYKLFKSILNAIKNIAHSLSLMKGGDL